MNKISSYNYLFMLAYAFDMNWKYKTSDAERTDIEDLSYFELLFFVLIKGTELLLKRIPLRKYILQNESIKKIRGKIEFQNIFHNLSKKKGELNCSFDELSFDILENQIILSSLITVSKVMRKKNKDDYSKQREKLLKLSRNLSTRLENHINVIELTKLHFLNINFNRLNQHYKPLIDICFFLFESLALYTDGLSKIFDVEENKLHQIFEAFLRNYLKEQLKPLGYSISSPREDYWLITLDNQRPKYMPSIKPDITIKKDNKVCFVLDAKFYSDPVYKSSFSSSDEEKYKTHSHNLYQIMAYTDYYNSDGLLVYAETESGYFNEVVKINRSTVSQYFQPDRSFGFYTLNLLGDLHEFKSRLHSFRDMLLTKFQFDSE